MAGLVVQHNLSALNANNKMNTNVVGLKKATEKLSSGYQINRAGDNAAGLAISEKMRSQIRGLSQAVKNANDGISLIQTAEGGLNETHSILQRMRELAVQSANGTYQDDTDREAIQLEVDALKSEIDRISTATEYNGMQLLDGSLGGSSNTNSYGALYGIAETQNDLGGGLLTVTSDIPEAVISFTVGASGKGGENAVWNADGKKIAVNLVEGKSYTDDEINTLIKNATKGEADDGPYAKPNITFKSEFGVIKGAAVDMTATEAGARDTGTVDLEALVGNTATGAIGSSDKITITANSYGANGKFTDELLSKLTIKTDVGVGKETAEISTAATATAGAEVTLHLSTGVEYTNEDIEKLLKEAGYDYTVELTDSKGSPQGTSDGKILFNVKDTTGKEITLGGGAGVGKFANVTSGEGLTFQIGANGVEDQRVTLTVDDMSSKAIGVAQADVSTQAAANKAIEMVDAAVKKVSMQRAGLGAMQNRLEYTVNNLTTTGENLTNAESQIRDTDMATEMINYTKFNILQQASQAMLAQANQQPQAVLQLLG